MKGAKVPGAKTTNVRIEAMASHRLERPGRLVPAVVSGLLDRIVVGEFTPGTLLPKESELVVGYGVSRTVIREALRVLEEKGLIDIQQGRGTVVMAQDDWNLLDPQVMSAQIANDRGFTVLENLADVRAAMEAELTRVATAQLDAEGLVALGEALSRLSEALDDHRRYLDVDQEFHDIILRAASNPVARQIVRNVHGWNSLNPHRVSYGKEQIESAHRGHVDVYELIVARDAEAAAERMRSHILDSWITTRGTMREGR
jgi:DNA-binding FadR family transcriptional regulator